jgi:hypothetical protein
MTEEEKAGWRVVVLVSFIGAALLFTLASGSWSYIK